MRFDRRKPVLSPETVERLPEFGRLTDQQKTFILLLASGATVLVATQGAFSCKNSRTAKSFSYDLMNRRTLQPVLNRLYGLKSDDRSEFLKRVDKLLRRGSRITQAEIDTLVLYGISNDLLPRDYSPSDELKALGDLK